MTYIPILSDKLSNSTLIDQNNFRLAHKTSNIVGKLFSNMKDQIEKYGNDNVIYKITCKGSGTENCNKIRELLQDYHHTKQS